MSELSPYCARCRHLRGACRCPEGPSKYYTEPQTVHEAYINLRASCAALEELIAHEIEDDQHHLDKAVVVMKVGFKMVKQHLRSQGLEGNLKVPQPAQQGTTERVQ